MPPEFQPLSIAIVTVSDTRQLASDLSGDTLAERVTTAGHHVAAREIVTDDVPAIESKLRSLIANTEVQAILCTGGTGLTGRDVTPEAFRRVLDKELPGFGELFRQLSYATIGTAAMLSRAVGGVSRGKLLFALPGSPSAVAQAWDEILVHQLDRRTRPGNLVALLPRLLEGQPETPTVAQIAETATAPHYTWGGLQAADCDGWHLMMAPGLSVIEERMPPGTAEVRHRHIHARQFFYVLEGELTLEVEGQPRLLGGGQGLEVAPGQVHQVLNQSAAAVRMLVISQSPSHGDRTPA